MGARETEADVVDVPAEHRFVLGAGEELSELTYRLNGDRLVLTHTRVPEKLRDQGRAGRLVAAAVARAGRENLTVVPFCPYARDWLTDHPAEAATVKIDWRLKV